jgi:DNA-binding transcriptional regulator GbsR (MarR family)
MAAESEPRLAPTAEKFVLHWGEMGTKWGINRTVAQIHALLYLSPEPLHAERIAALLKVARSNVSNSLRELQNWRLIRTVHVIGDRRDHFETSKDVWDLFRTIMEERKRREIDPTLALLDECVAEMDRDRALRPAERRALSEMKKFAETASGFYTSVEKLPKAALVQLMKMGAALPKLIGRKGG